MFFLYLPLLISLVGLLLYALSANPNGNAKVAAIGLHMFWVGLLAFLLNYHGPR